ncbi:MAG: BadF/BadG/BcrA/BcrD ATPase family protein, partial [Sulfolobales archaeon]
AGPGNFHNVGIDIARKNILEAVLTATQGKRANFAVIGAAGLDSKYDLEILNSSLNDIADKVIIEHDSFIVLYSQSEKPRGIVVLSGTGSVVVGYYDDKRIRAGGYGWLLSDEGSAYWIGREALRILVKMLDGRIPRTKLADSLLQKMKLESLDDVIKWTYYEGHKVEEIASLASVVCNEAEKNKDEYATKIIEQATKELAEDVIYISDLLKLKEVYISGGMFNCKIYYQKFCSNLQYYKIIRVTKEPVLGAIFYALDLLGLGSCKERIKNDYSFFG